MTTRKPPLKPSLIIFVSFTYLLSSTVYYRNVFCESNLRHNFFFGLYVWLVVRSSLMPPIMSSVMSYHTIMFYVFNISRNRDMGQDCFHER